MLYKKGRVNVYLVLAIIIILIALLAFYLFREREVVIMGHETVKVEIVSTQMDQYRGLSNRENLCWECGMLFTFPTKQPREFVMREMNFALDIIFITDNRIVKIAEKLRPEDDNPLIVYSSDEPVDVVLEVNAGYVDDKRIRVGDVVKIK